jgi:hypothetical protein
VPGSNDRRSYTVRGVLLDVIRGSGARTVSFEGQGPDGDFVAPDAPQVPVLDAMVAGIEGVRRVSVREREIASDAELDRIEARLEAESGGAETISRTGDGTVALARALLALPVRAGTTRTFSLRARISLTVSFGSEGDATATPWAWGRDPGDWLARTLTELGVPIVIVSGSGNGAVLAVPRGHVAQLVERALAHEPLGPNDVRMIDARARA